MPVRYCSNLSSQEVAREMAFSAVLFCMPLRYVCQGTRLCEGSDHDTWGVDYLEVSAVTMARVSYYSCALTKNSLVGIEGESEKKGFLGAY